MVTIVQGKLIAKRIIRSLRKRLAKLEKKNIIPKLAIVLVGSDPSSIMYIKKKEAAARSIGIECLRLEFPGNASKQKIIQGMSRISKNHNLSGMILQLPLPDNLWRATREIADSINTDIDVDCMSHESLGHIMANDSFLVPPTPSAIFEVFKKYRISLSGKYICVIGRGDLIGKPIAAMLSHLPVTFTLCGKATMDLSQYTKQADIIITGVGKKGLISGQIIKKGAVIIDAGICFSNGKLYGDVDFESALKKSSLITPVPGGIGPITVAKLLENTIIAAENKCK